MYLYEDDQDSGSYYSIRESYREGDTVKTGLVDYIGTVEALHDELSKTSIEDATLHSINFGRPAALRWAWEDLELDGLFTEVLDPNDQHNFDAWKKMFVLVWRRFCQDMSINEAVDEYESTVFPYWWRTPVPVVQRFYQFMGDKLDPETVGTLQTEILRNSLADASVGICHFDTTNYTTYVSDDTTYLQIGKSKDGIRGRRIVGLALAVSHQQMPLMATAYPGNVQDGEIFPELFDQLCARLETAGKDLSTITLIMDRGFDGERNYNLVSQADSFVVAAVPRTWTAIKEVLEDVDVETFDHAYETRYGNCYVTDCEKVTLGEIDWRLILSCHDTTREKTQNTMDERRAEAEKVLKEHRERLVRGGPGRPPTENSVERSVKKILKDYYQFLDWSLDTDAKELEWTYTEGWKRRYGQAGIQPLITDREDWSAAKVAKTYFDQQDLEDIFHLTKEAIVVPVTPSYVKKDDLVRGHLFTIFVGLVCYHHIKRTLPEGLSDKEIKKSLERLDMVTAIEDDELSFVLANVDERTEPLLESLNLEEYLPS